MATLRCFMLQHKQLLPMSVLISRRRKGTALAFRSSLKGYKVAGEEKKVAVTKLVAGAEEEEDEDDRNTEIDTNALQVEQTGNKASIMSALQNPPAAQPLAPAQRANKEENEN